MWAIATDKPQTGGRPGRCRYPYAYTRAVPALHLSADTQIEGGARDAEQSWLPNCGVSLSRLTEVQHDFSACHPALAILMCERNVGEWEYPVDQRTNPSTAHQIGDPREGGAVGAHEAPEIAPTQSRLLGHAGSQQLLGASRPLFKPEFVGEANLRRGDGNVGRIGMGLECLQQVRLHVEGAI